MIFYLLPFSPLISQIVYELIALKDLALYFFTHTTLISNLKTESSIEIPTYMIPYMMNPYMMSYEEKSCQISYKLKRDS